MDSEVNGHATGSTGDDADAGAFIVQIKGMLAARQDEASLQLSPREVSSELVPTFDKLEQAVLKYCHDRRLGLSLSDVFVTLSAADLNSQPETNFKYRWPQKYEFSPEHYNAMVADASKSRRSCIVVTVVKTLQVAGIASLAAWAAGARDGASMSEALSARNGGADDQDFNWHPPFELQPTIDPLPDESGGKTAMLTSLSESYCLPTALEEKLLALDPNLSAQHLAYIMASRTSQVQAFEGKLTYRDLVCLRFSLASWYAKVNRFKGK